MINIEASAPKPTSVYLIIHLLTTIFRIVLGFELASLFYQILVVPINIRIFQCSLTTSLHDLRHSIGSVIRCDRLSKETLLKRRVRTHERATDFVCEEMSTYIANMELDFL